MSSQIKNYSNIIIEKFISNLLLIIICQLIEIKLEDNFNSDDSNSYKNF